MFLKLGLLAFVILWGTGFQLGHWSNFTPFVSRSADSAPLIGALAGGVVGAFFSFAGWWDLGKLAGEVKNPARTLPRALTYGVIIVTIVYVLTSLNFVYLVPLNQVTSGETFAAQAGEVLFGRAGGLIFSLIVVVAVLGSITAVVMSAPMLAQTPQPFPRPGNTQAPPKPAQPAPKPSTPPPASPPATQAPAAPPRTAPSQPGPTAPSASEIGFPIYPAAQFIASYDAGRGQRYYIYGATAPFVDVVTYYRTQLDERGSLVFKEPPTHMFEVGRFREETMAFPPGVTVKDWTWGGSQGYPNPAPKGPVPPVPRGPLNPVKEKPNV